MQQLSSLSTESAAYELVRQFAQLKQQNAALKTSATAACEARRRWLEAAAEA